MNVEVIQILEPRSGLNNKGLKFTKRFVLADILDKCKNMCVTKPTFAPPNYKEHLLDNLCD